MVLLLGLLKALLRIYCESKDIGLSFIELSSSRNQLNTALSFISFLVSALKFSLLLLYFIFPKNKTLSLAARVPGIIGVF